MLLLVALIALASPLAQEPAQASPGTAALRAEGDAAMARRDWDAARDAFARAYDLDLDAGHLGAAALDAARLGDALAFSTAFAAAAEHYATAAELAERAGDRGLALAALENGGRIEAFLGRYDGARATYEDALASAQTLGDRPRESSLLVSLANLESANASYAEALVLLDRGSLILAELGDAPGLAHALVQIAAVSSEVGRTADAEAALARAIGLLEEADLPVERAEALVTQGLVLLDAGRYEEALDPLVRGADVLAEAGRDPSVARAKQLEGHARLALGDRRNLRLAREAFARSASLRPAEIDPFGRALSLTGLADVLEALETYDLALATYEDALDAARGLATPEASWRAHAGRGRALERLGRETEALAEYQTAIAEVEGIRTLLAAPALRARYLGDKLDLLQGAAVLAARLGELPEAFRLAELARARTLVELVAERPTKSRLAVPKGLLQRLERTEGELSMLELRLADLARFAPGGDAERELRSRLAGARDRHEAARLQVALADPRRAGLTGIGDTAPLDEVAAAVDVPGLAVVAYCVGPQRSGAFVLEAGRARFVELAPGRAEIEAQVARVLAPFDDLRAGRTDVYNLGFDRHLAEELYEALVKPLGLANASEVWIARDGPLRRLPFALLVTKPGWGRVDHDELYRHHLTTRFWIDDVAIGYLPATALLTTGEGGRGDASALVLADPEPSPHPDLASLSSPDLGGGFDPLRRLEGKNADEASLRAAIAGARGVVHFAVHGELLDRRPAFSRLALAATKGGDDDGWLHAFEAERLELEGALVVLAACETAGVAGRGEGLLGLARSFLIAGASNVIASSWQVADEATADLMSAFYRELHAGRAPAHALRRAQLEVLRGGGRPGIRFAHPFFWAAFGVIGRP